ncbi:hypothetical protein BESB_023250 [Besnoitia besnoiti]|uniref:CCDC113/CCDC96 coiled-coil domain-containing protein n=1 Tax=Besnoitia besnoiti TaxID=94643 RepID=A0A2A9M829_BESBE|nr:hypothetical protein BESB_023250 [Besnoitia besnoiti]PFH31833.1 hypothetical protein BESB_023250 [Besnoitia besnoiti]
MRRVASPVCPEAIGDGATQLPQNDVVEIVGIPSRRGSTSCNLAPILSRGGSHSSTKEGVERERTSPSQEESACQEQPEAAEAEGVGGECGDGGGVDLETENRDRGEEQKPGPSPDAADPLKSLLCMSVENTPSNTEKAAAELVPPTPQQQHPLSSAPSRSEVKCIGAGGSLPQVVESAAATQRSACSGADSQRQGANQCASAEACGPQPALNLLTARGGISEAGSVQNTIRDSSEPSSEAPEGAIWVAAELERLDNEYEQMSVEADSLRDELKRVKEENSRVEKKLAMKFSTTGDFPVYRAQTGDPRLTTAQYFATLRALEATEEEKKLTAELAAKKADQENRLLKTHGEKVEECRAAFRSFLRKVAKNSQMARSGKPIPEAILGQLMRLEEEKTSTLQEARVECAKLKHQLDLLHKLVSENDMQEQFHVMDFEQLKIENQALNEKIVERNEEIKKLRSIIVSSVQFITHWKEKIHFLDHENARSTEELAHLDAELANQRHLITKSKRERDEYRAENGKLRQQTDIINSDILALDWETRQQRKQELKLEVAYTFVSHIPFRHMCVQNSAVL